MNLTLHSFGPQRVKEFAVVMYLTLLQSSEIRENLVVHGCVIDTPFFPSRDGTIELKHYERCYFVNSCMLLHGTKYFNYFKCLAAGGHKTYSMCAL